MLCNLLLNPSHIPWQLLQICSQSSDHLPTKAKQCLRYVVGYVLREAQACLVDPARVKEIDHKVNRTGGYHHQVRVFVSSATETDQLDDEIDTVKESSTNCKAKIYLKKTLELPGKDYENLTHLLGRTITKGLKVQYLLTCVSALRVFEREADCLNKLVRFREVSIEV